VIVQPSRLLFPRLVRKWGDSEEPLRTAAVFARSSGLFELALYPHKFPPPPATHLSPTSYECPIGLPITSSHGVLLWAVVRSTIAFMQALARLRFPPGGKVGIAWRFLPSRDALRPPRQVIPYSSRLKVLPPFFFPVVKSLPVGCGIVLPYFSRGL